MLTFGQFSILSSQPKIKRKKTVETKPKKAPSTLIQFSNQNVTLHVRRDFIWICYASFIIQARVIASTWKLGWMDYFSGLSCGIEPWFNSDFVFFLRLIKLKKCDYFKVNIWTSLFLQEAWFAYFQNPEVHFPLHQTLFVRQNRFHSIRAFNRSVGLVHNSDPN